MTPARAQRQAELLSDCLVSPDVFHHMVARLRDFGFCRKFCSGGHEEANAPVCGGD